MFRRRNFMEKELKKAKKSARSYTWRTTTAYFFTIFGFSSLMFGILMIIIGLENGVAPKALLFIPYTYFYLFLGMGPVDPLRDVFGISVGWRSEIYNLDSTLPVSYMSLARYECLRIYRPRVMALGFSKEEFDEKKEVTWFENKFLDRQPVKMDEWHAQVNVWIKKYSYIFIKYNMLGLFSLIFAILFTLLFAVLVVFEYPLYYAIAAYIAGVLSVSAARAQLKLAGCKRTLSSKKIYSPTKAECPVCKCLYSHVELEETRRISYTSSQGFTTKSEVVEHDYSPFYSSKAAAYLDSDHKKYYTKETRVVPTETKITAYWADIGCLYCDYKNIHQLTGKIKTTETIY